MTLGYPTTPPPSMPPSMPSPAPPAMPPFGSAAEPSRRLDLDRPLVAAGVALLAAALVLSSFYSRKDGELDWSNYTVGLLATLGLLGIAAAAFVLARTADASTDLVAWPGAFGVAGVGLMIAVAMDEGDATAYVAGLSVVVLSVAGVLLTRRGPFVVTAVLGFYVTYAQLLDDVLGVADDDEIGAISIALALALFAVIVTVVGWLRPESRVLAGAVAGVLTVIGFATLTGVLAVAQALQAVFAPLSAMGEDGPPETPAVDQYHNDAWVILVLALLLVVGWAACAALTRHVVFRILMVAMVASVVPLVTVVLSVEHPSWWGMVLGAVGGGLLVLGTLRALQVSRRGSLDAR